jgi:hypothetical protein
MVQTIHQIVRKKMEDMDGRAIQEGQVRIVFMIEVEQVLTMF